MNYRNSDRWTRFEGHWSRTRNMRCNYSPLFLSTPLFICIFNTVAFVYRCATSTHANHRWDTNLTTQLSSQFRPPAQRISCCMCAHTKNLGYATSRRTNDPLLPSERGQGRGCVARTLDLFLVARSRLRRLRNDKFVHAPRINEPCINTKCNMIFCCMDTAQELSRKMKDQHYHGRLASMFLFLFWWFDRTNDLKTL